MDVVKRCEPQSGRVDVVAFTYAAAIPTAARMARLERAQGVQYNAKTAGEEGESCMGASVRFVRVAHMRDIAPGQLLRVEMAERLVCLANVDGKIYAVDDECTHIGGALSDGELEGCMLTCPVHLARFDVRDGRVLRGPAREDVQTYTVRVEGDDILIEEPE
jgi:nitrite reductase/ring-hydroxylating ferredoxin subunit